MACVEACVPSVSPEMASYLAFAQAYRCAPCKGIGFTPYGGGLHRCDHCDGRGLTRNAERDQARTTKVEDLPNF